MTDHIFLTALRYTINSLNDLSFPDTRLGIIPGAGGTYRPCSLIDKARALDLILTGRIASGLEPYSYGLCQYLVRPPPDDGCRAAVLDEAIKVARKIAIDGDPVNADMALRREQDEEGEGEVYHAVRRARLIARLVREKGALESHDPY